MNVKQVVVNGLLPLLVMAGGVAGAVTLIRTRPVPKQKPRDERGLLVEVQAVASGSHRVQVRAHGTVTEAYEVDVSAELGGRIIWKNPELTTGGRVHKGDPLLKIDPRDYKLAMAQQHAAVAKAEAELELERGRKRVAEDEWKRFGSVDTGAPNLATREPQMRSAELGLDTAKSALDQARLRLDRTTLRAPFDAIVRSNQAEEGQVVAPQQSVAQLVNSDIFVVSVSLPVEDLRWLRVPGMNAPLLTEKDIEALAQQGPNTQENEQRTSFAWVRQPVGDAEIERWGFVTRLLGDLDPVGRMARLLVAIADPLGMHVKEPPQGAAGLPLLLGAYVDVDLFGMTLDDLVEVPRLALRNGDFVYVATADNTLDIRAVEVARRRPDSVLVRAGLRDGERVITSAMPSAVQGMELRVKEVVEGSSHAGLTGEVTP